MEKPEHYSTEPAATLTDQELAETWRYIAKRYDMEENGDEAVIHTFGGGSFESDRLYAAKRLNELEPELLERNLQPTEDDDGLLFAVVTEDGERIA